MSEDTERREDARKADAAQHAEKKETRASSNWQKNLPASSNWAPSYKSGYTYADGESWSEKNDEEVWESTAVKEENDGKTKVRKTNRKPNRLGNKLSQLHLLRSVQEQK